MLINTSIPNQSINNLQTNNLSGLVPGLQSPVNNNLLSGQGICLPQQNTESLLIGLLERVISSLLSIFDRLFGGQVIQPQVTTNSESGMDKILNKGSELVGGFIEKMGNSIFNGISSGLGKILGF